ncbi:MAG: M28 family peptidase [Bacilli bacterium]
MTKKILDELSYLQERMHRKSKSNFREYLKSKATKYGLEYNIFPNSFASKNVVIGNLKKAKFVLGAHYDTPPRMPAFLMRSILFFNILSFLFVPFVIIILILLELPIIIAPLIYLGLLLYLMGFGIANKFNYNDNTSGVLTLLAIMAKHGSNDVAYVFFDNEEKGLIGSLQMALILRKLGHYQPRKKIFINFDCVGRGNVFGVASFKNKRVAQDLIDLSNNKDTSGLSFVHRKASRFEASDHFSFRNWNSLGIMCYNRKRKKYVLKNIHSHKDKYIELKNINVLVDLICDLIVKEVMVDGRI